ncbi:MbcA/ParS/Xre antitoxin family protein (plasmid) [Polaromonas sp. P1-6]|nr:MbcA/ParS/Xre antitoxin family protein [Polaromonas sp. P1-6]
MAKTTFETEDDARVWLERPHPLLDGESPLEAAKTTPGAQHVKQILIAIKYGGAV